MGALVGVGERVAECPPIVEARHGCKPYLEDHYTADWLARFTKRPYDWWLALVGDGQVHEFGVAEALEWGVIDEVLEGV